MTPLNFLSFICDIISFYNSSFTIYMLERLDMSKFMSFTNAYTSKIKKFLIFAYKVLSLPSGTDVIYKVHINQ